MRLRPTFLSLFGIGALAALLGAPAPSAAESGSCVFTIGMQTGADVNNLDFSVNYGGAPGEIEGSGSKANCVSGLGGSNLFAVNDNDNGVLKVALARLSHFSSPVTVLACRFLYESLEPLPADFTISVTNAGRDGGEDNVQPHPVLQVTKVDCPGEFPVPTTTTTIPETTTTLPSNDSCGFPVSTGAKPTASDALRTLRVAVGVGDCALCVCDVNSSGSVTTGDALAILRAAVGGSVTLHCPAC